MSQPTFYVASDSFLWILGLVDNAGAYVTGATVTATLADSAGVAVGTSISLTYQAGAQTINGTAYAGGNYRGLLAHTVALASLSQYTVTIVISSGAYQTTKVFNVPAIYDGLA